MANEITLLTSWPSHKYARGYRVRLLSPEGAVLSEQDTTENSVVFGPVSEATAYKVELVAYHRRSESVPQVIDVTTPTGVLGGTSAVYNWGNSVAGDSVRLLDGDGVLVEDLGQVTSPATLPDLARGTAYQVELTRADGSVDTLAFFSAVELPGEIANLAYDYTRTTLTFTWDAASNAHQYELFLFKEGELVSQQSVQALTATFEELQGGIYYDVQVRAINVTGGVGPDSFLTGKTSPVPLDIVGDEYAEAVYLSKPVAYWRMSDEAGSLVVRDMMEQFAGVVNGPSPFGNHASIMPSGGGRAAYLDGTTWIDLGNDAALGPLNSMAVSFWFLPTDDSLRRGLVHKAYGGTLGSTYEPSNRVSFYHGTSGYDGSTYQGVSAEAPVNQVRHVVLERDNDLGYLTIYMNGYPVLRTDDSYPTATRGSNSLKIGKGHVTDLFKGYIQDVALFDRALGDKEVAAHVTAAGGEPPLVPDFGYHSVTGLVLGSPLGWNPKLSEQYRLPNPTIIPRSGRTELMEKIVTSENVGFFDQVDGSGGHPVDPNGRPSDFTRQGVIQGTVTDDQGKAASRRLQVLERRTGRLVRQGWSNPSDGTYRFDDLDPNKEWTVLGYDYSGQYNALISDRVRPVALRYDTHGDTSQSTVVWFAVSDYLLQMQWAPVRGEPTEVRLYMSKTEFNEASLPVPEVLPGDAREWLDASGMVFDDWYVAVGLVYELEESISPVYKYTSSTDKPAEWSTLPTDGLIASYTFPDGSLADEISGIEGTQSGEVSDVVSPHGTGKAFSRSVMSSNITLPSPGDIRTISMWVRDDTTENAWRGAYNWWGGDNNKRSIILFSDSNTRQFGIYHSGNKYLVDTPLEVGRWYHAAFLYDGSKTRMFIDGVEVGTGYSGNLVSVQTPQNVYLGNYKYNSDLNSSAGGALDQVRFYNRALTPDEIQELYMEISS